MSLKDRFKTQLTTQPNIKRQTEQLPDIENASFMLTKNEKIETVEKTQRKGYGPLDLLMADATISEIYINGAQNIYVKKDGVLTKSNIYFKDNKHLTSVLEELLDKNNVNHNNEPILNNIKLSNGLIMDVILAPLAVSGPIITIKKPKLIDDTLESLLQGGVLTKEMSETLLTSIKAGLNILIVGDIDSGKTALLNALSTEIPNDENIIILDSVNELSLTQPQIISLATANSISAELLINNISNLNPDRIIIDSLNAINVCLFKRLSNKGLLMSVCSNKDAVKSISALLTSYNLTDEAAKYLVSSTINLIIKVEKLTNGTRKITSISEVSYSDDASITEIFSFKKNSKSANGTHISCGTKPEFIKNIKDKDLSIPLSYFNKERKHTYSNKKIQTPKSPTKKSAIKSRFISANNDFTD